MVDHEAMHDSIIDNNGLRQNLELMEKRLQSLAEYQQVLSFATLNSKIDDVIVLVAIVDIVELCLLACT
jgi:hypothetical protein